MRSLVVRVPLGPESRKKNRGMKHIHLLHVAAAFPAARSERGKTPAACTPRCSQPDGAIVSFLVSRGAGGEAPRCLVRTHLDAMTRHPDASEWLGDFELCVAWCWLEDR